MTAADASLVVAVGLVFGTAVCRLTVWAHRAGDHRTAVARTYLTPSADWGLVAIAGHALALILTGDAAVTAWVTIAVLACLVLALRDPAPGATPALEAEEPPATEPEPAAIAPLIPPSLWAQPGRDSSRPPPAR